ncbi:Hypothetical predicted protein [Olea europaea subsp. europaea]|uniref:Uncharacterized protein n=1 Tax=Olea europaea subsp. europaea TaxID=158383 RepID=A0A8S0RBA4_OLEEU|nr:Hypothetical predicted protein [Olea europaea subsp. europaea]
MDSIGDPDDGARVSNKGRHLCVKEVVGGAGLWREAGYVVPTGQLVIAGADRYGCWLGWCGGWVNLDCGRAPSDSVMCQFYEEKRVFCIMLVILLHESWH